MTDDQIVEHVRGIILGRFRQLKNDLEILVLDGVDFRFPPSGRLCPTEASEGICVVLDHISDDVYMESSDDYDNAYKVLLLFTVIVKERMPMGVYGRYPISVTPDNTSCDQYWSFHDCVSKHDYCSMSKETFDLYANARIVLIDQAIEDVKNARIGYESGSYVRL